jgi:hypothetical protein
MRTMLLILLVPATLQAQCEEVGVATGHSWSASNRGSGVKFDCTSSVIIDRWSAEFELPAAQTLDFMVFESTDAGVTWNLIDSESVAGLGPGRTLYGTSPGRSIPLVTGRRYAFMTFHCSTATYWDDQMGAGTVISFATVGSGAGGIPGGVRYTVSCTPGPTPTLADNGDNVIHTEFCPAGPMCTINAPAPAAVVSGAVTLDYDVDHVTGLPVDALVEHSTDAGATWLSCTPVSGVNPVLGIPTPSTGLTLEWDSFGDGVGIASVRTTELRITVDDGTDTSVCQVQVDVDNVPVPPTCTVTLTSGTPVAGVGSFELQADSVNSPAVDATFEFTTDGGATYALATAGPASSNPLPGVAVLTPTPFDWDSRADGVGLAAPVTGVLLRATVDDGVAATSSCAAAPLDVDNTALCTGICGDCSLDGIGPSVVDALVAAQIAAGLMVPSPIQTGCCDVNSTGAIEVLDALLIAQTAAGLGVTLLCP